MDRDELLRLIDQAAREGWTKMDLSNQGLAELLPEIGQLITLTELDLWNNRLTTLPPEIGRLTNLRRFTLGRRIWQFLESTPGSKIMLGTTESTDLSSETIQSTTLPLTPDMNQIAVSFSFDTQDNGSFALPAEIGQLTALTSLDLSDNRLTVLPAEIGQLTALTSLDLSGNRLTVLPAEIGQLLALIELYLDRNQLTSLPSEMARLTRLEVLDLRFTLLSLPPEIVAKIDAPRAIIQAWFDYLGCNTHPLNEIKLVFVGEGGVGKTSLVNRLLHNTFDPHSEKTEGIAIHRWKVNGNSASQQISEPATYIRVNVWDFGGQEILHTTHQFFLTRRTLYVLVMDSRLSEVENRLDYWLKIIHSFSGDSPVLVVVNKTDQHALDFGRLGLLAKYHDVQAILETSCATGAGIPELRAAIANQIAAMPHVRDPIVTTWFEVKAALEALDTDYIPYSDYLRLCREKNVSNPDSQRVLLGFLHDLGVVLHFPDPRLETTNILKPEWVTQGVYLILNTRLPFAEPGVLTWEMLARILDDETYQEKRLFIVDMMQKFELCYEIPDRPQTYLIPDLLPREPRYLGDDFAPWDNALRFEVHYPVLPGSILTRLIVRMHWHIRGQTVWRTGVLLACDDNEALVKADLAANRIAIAVRGPGTGRRELLTRIREHLEAIHASLAGLEAAEKVPVPDHRQIPPVDYKWLRELERKGVPEFYPPGLTDPISVRQLLDGVEPPSARREREMRGGNTFVTNVYGGQVGVIGDDADVEGGIHS